MHSCQDAGFHRELKNFMVLLRHNMLDRPFSRVTLYRDVSIPKNELLEDVAVEGVDWQDFVQTHEDLLEDAEGRVYVWCEFFCKVNGLINGHLRCFFLIFLEQVGKSFNHDNSFHNLLHVKS